MKGSRYLRGRGPLQLVFQCAVENRSLASRAERRIKQLSKAQKKALIAAPGRMSELLGPD